MKPEILAAALTQWRTVVLLGGQMPAATIVDNHVLTLETTLLLAAENMDRQTKERDALLWILWHHQGGSSTIGQPIRAALGMGPFDDMTPEQLVRAKEFERAKTFGGLADFRL
jgi:hypothetical protein